MRGGKGSLQVLNTNRKLETVYAWRDEDRWPLMKSAIDVISVWAANSTLMGAVQLAGPLQRHRLDACWNPSMQQSDECAEAVLARKLLASIDIGDSLIHITWGPGHKIAAIAKLSEPKTKASHFHDVSFPAIDHKLYVLDSEQGIARKDMA